MNNMSWKVSSSKQSVYLFIHNIMVIQISKMKINKVDVCYKASIRSALRLNGYEVLEGDDLEEIKFLSLLKARELGWDLDDFIKLGGCRGV